MCMEVKKECFCGKNSASFNLRDNIMIPEVVSGLYCPECSHLVKEFDSETMIDDNGWIIVYDMMLAKGIAAQKLSDAPITPELLFDQGYVTWKEIYPGELEDSKEEKARLASRASVDRRALRGMLRGMKRKLYPYQLDGVAKFLASPGATRYRSERQGAGCVEKA